MVAYKVVANRRSLFAPDGWTKTYRKGAVVVAKAGTIGLFCFYRKEDAEDFYEHSRRFARGLRVIRVSVRKDGFIFRIMEHRLIAYAARKIDCTPYFAEFYAGVTRHASGCVWGGCFTAARVRVLD